MTHIAYQTTCKHHNYLQIFQFLSAFYCFIRIIASHFFIQANNTTINDEKEKMLLL